VLWHAVTPLLAVLQDIVTASPHFSVEGFIPRLRDYLRVTNPYKRQFLISWVSAMVVSPLSGVGHTAPVLQSGALKHFRAPASASAACTPPATTLVQCLKLCSQNPLCCVAPCLAALVCHR
jgi:hypothetical protein